MPNDAKTRLDRDTHRLQDQATTSDPPRNGTGANPGAGRPGAGPARTQPVQAQQRIVTGTTLPDPAATLDDDDYGPKTGAATDHPYTDDGADPDPARGPGGDARLTPPDGHTEIDSEADLGDPSDR